MPEPLLRPLWRAEDGKVVHLNDCPHSAFTYRWKFAEGKSDDEVHGSIDMYPWLRWCGHCRNRHPEVLPPSKQDSPERVEQG